MPTYVEKWLPAYSPLAANLPNWKNLYNELNAKILAAGLVSADDGGALDINSVAALPAMGTYAGYKLFAFDDALQSSLPVIVKVEYGVGKIALVDSSGNNTYNTFPRARFSLIVGGAAAPARWPCPTGVDTHSGSPTATLSIVPGRSYIVYSPEKGFFGVVSGAGAYYADYFNSSMRGGVATFFVGRTTDASGTPTADGCVAFGPRLDQMTGDNNINNWRLRNYQPAVGQYVSAGGSPTLESRFWASRIGGVQATRAGSQIQVQKVFYQNPEIKLFPWLVSYNTADIPEGTEFDVEVFPGTMHRFVALGNENSAAPDATASNAAAFAMVFE